MCSFNTALVPHWKCRTMSRLLVFLGLPLLRTLHVVGTMSAVWLRLEALKASVKLKVRRIVPCFHAAGLLHTYQARLICIWSSRDHVVVSRRAVVRAGDHQHAAGQGGAWRRRHLGSEWGLQVGVGLRMRGSYGTESCEVRLLSGHALPQPPNRQPHCLRKLAAMPFCARLCTYSFL